MLVDYIPHPDKESATEKFLPDFGKYLINVNPNKKFPKFGEMAQNRKLSNDQKH